MTAPIDLLAGLQAALAPQYRIERELGGGGMSRVFVAEETTLGRRVVVKVLPPELAAAVSVERFRREIAVTAALQHPHIVPVHAAGEAAGLLYFTMPFVEGQSLRERLRHEGELPVNEAVRLLRDIADALAYAHEHGVVHRDLKPENVLLSTGHATVTDFGIARALSAAGAPGDGSERSRLSVTGLALGTPAYMAPEQAAGDAHVDHRADLYALGIVAYEMLSGAHPFAGRQTAAMMAAHVTETPEPLVKRRASVPPSLAALVMRLLEKRPADRQQSAADVVRELETAMTPSGAVTPAAAQAATGFSGRRRTRAVLFALVGAMVLLAGAVTAYRMRRPVTLARQRIIVVPPDNRTGNTALDHLGPMAADWITHGLLEVGLMEVVPAGTALAVKGVLAARTAEASALARRVALETGAGLVVSGAYYATGDSLRFQLQLADAGADRILAAIDPVVTPARDPMPAIEALRRRVSGALALTVDGQFKGIKLSSPPSYESYKLLVEGVVAGVVDQTVGVPLIRRALALDTTYQAARLWLASGLLNLNEFHESDAQLRIVERRPSSLSAYERIVLTWLRANLDGDRVASYRAVLEEARMAPTMVTRQQIGIEAIMLNHPREALDTLAHVDPRNAQMEGVWTYWSVMTDAHHALGEHEPELTAARAAKAQYPTLLAAARLEVLALAALGRGTEAERTLDQANNLRSQTPFSPGGLTRELALEFRTHGDSRSAERVSARAVRWYEALPRDQREPLLTEYAAALYVAGRWSDAREAIRRACGKTPDSVDCVGRLGTVSARLGAHEDARRLDERLAQMPLAPPVHESRALLWRARIAAVLGERDASVALLRQAFARGVGVYDYVATDFGYWPHRDPDLELLSDYPPFRELLRPKG